MDEAARFRGYTDSEWQNEPALSKARVICHFLEHNLRESFAYEKAKEAEASKSRKKGSLSSDFSRFRQGAASKNHTEQAP